MIVEVLDNILATPSSSEEVENDDVGIGIITSTENYGKYLLGAPDNLTVLERLNIGVPVILSRLLVSFHDSMFYCSNREFPC